MPHHRPSARRFGRHSRGSVGVMLVLATVVLAVWVGLSIDTSRLENESARLQTTCDAITLGMVRYTGWDHDLDVLKTFVKENDQLARAAVANPANCFVLGGPAVMCFGTDSLGQTFWYFASRATGKVEAVCGRNLNTTLMRLKGIQVSSVNATSAASGCSDGEPEIAIALDHSIGDNNLDDEQRETSIIQSTRYFVSRLNEIFNGKVKVALVPFIAAVHIKPTLPDGSPLKMPPRQGAYAGELPRAVPGVGSVSFTTSATSNFWNLGYDWCPVYGGTPSVNMGRDGGAYFNSLHEESLVSRGGDGMGGFFHNNHTTNTGYRRPLDDDCTDGSAAACANDPNRNRYCDMVTDPTRLFFPIHPLVELGGTYGSTTGLGSIDKELTDWLAAGTTGSKPRWAGGGRMSLVEGIKYGGYVLSPAKTAFDEFFPGWVAGGWDSRTWASSDQWNHRKGLYFHFDDPFDQSNASSQCSRTLIILSNGNDSAASEDDAAYRSTGINASTGANDTDSVGYDLYENLGQGFNLTSSGFDINTATMVDKLGGWMQESAWLEAQWIKQGQPGHPAGRQPPVVIYASSYSGGNCDSTSHLRRYLFGISSACDGQMKCKGGDPNTVPNIDIIDTAPYDADDFPPYFECHPGNDNHGHQDPALYASWGLDPNSFDLISFYTHILKDLQNRLTR